MHYLRYVNVIMSRTLQTGITVTNGLLTVPMPIETNLYDQLCMIINEEQI